MKLLERFAAKANEARQSAIQQYRELLRRIDEPRSGDEERFGAIIAELGITPADAEADAMALRDVTRIEAETPTDEQVEAAKKQGADLREKWDADSRAALCEMIMAMDQAEIVRAYENLTRNTGGPQAKYDARVIEAVREVTKVEGDALNLQQHQDSLRKRVARIKGERHRVFG